MPNANDILKATQQAMNDLNIGDPGTPAPQVTPPAPVVDDDFPAEPPKNPEPSKPAEPPKEPETKTPVSKEEEPVQKPITLDKKFAPVSYERFKEVNDKYKALQDEVKKANDSKKDRDPDDEDTIEEKARLKKLGFMSAEDQEQRQFEIKEQSIRQEEQDILAREVKSLEQEFNGTDGLPKFEKDTVLAWGMENQVFDPKSAYIVMNLEAIVNHLVSKEVAELRKTPVFTKNNTVPQPMVTPKDRLHTNDGTLKNHLTSVISNLISGD